MTAQIQYGACSSPIARHILKDVDQRIIPGCSAAEHGRDSPVLISNTMLQAYNKMRGPAAKDSQEDPLFEWIHLRDDICSGDGKTAQPRSRRDIFHMLHKVDETLSEGNAAGDSPREAIFEINRPVTADHHIRAPPRHDFSTHLLTACCAEFEFESDDSDDDETSIPHGRISPCTFLAWSKGCQRWSGDNIKVPIDQNQPRRRPPTPEVVDTPPFIPRPFRFPGFDVERQVDASTGYEMSPCYAVPTSPSLLYVPEGVDAIRNQNPTAFEGRYSRMDPMAGKSLRRLLFYGRPNGPSGGGTPTASPTMADADVDEYGHSEVEDLLNSPSARPPQGQDPTFPTTPAFLGHQLSQAYAVIAANEAQADGLTQLLRNQTAQIRELREEREHLSAAVGIVQSRRRREQQEQEERAWRRQHNPQQQQRLPSKTPEEKRQQRVHKHVAAHLEEVQYKFMRAADTLGHERMSKENNDAAIAQLEMEIADLCHEAGLNNPAEVYDALTGKDSLDDEDDDDVVAASSSCETKQERPHHEKTKNNDNHSGKYPEGGRDGDGSGRRKARDNIPPPLSPLLVTTNRIIHPPASRKNPVPTPHKYLSRPPPLVQAGAIPYPQNHLHHNGGQFEDDPLPRLKSQYLEMIRTNSHGCAIVDDHDHDHNKNNINNHNKNGNGCGMDAPSMKDNRNLLESNGGRQVPLSRYYDAHTESEEVGEYDNAQYQAVERVLETTEAYIAQLDQRRYAGRW
ncbi:hypothetical protein PG995_015181 [Apiospora arundinis]|uniref:Uncharacterized protein n=1 Tax=Apiospora arundinis TaxID=335852 RepID=A0ABR2IFY5_9PEZI